MVEAQQSIHLNGMNAPVAKEPLVWLITGTGSGMGARLTRVALSRGDRVIATARTEESLQELLSQHLSSLPKSQLDNLRTLQLDVTTGEEAINAKVQTAHEHWGKIDVLVNNAAAGYPSLTEEAGSTLLRKQFAANTFGVMDMTTAVLPYMRARRSGTIVMIGSRSAYKTNLMGIGPYAASKAATHAFTGALTVEVAQFNIRVMLVSPGSFRTERMYSRGFYSDNKIPDYDETRKKTLARFATIPGTEKGDPYKGMSLIADIVRDEGAAKGRPWPTQIFLGDDAARDLRIQQQNIIEELEAWEDLSSNVHFSN